MLSVVLLESFLLIKILKYIFFSHYLLIIQTSDHSFPACHALLVLWGSYILFNYKKDVFENNIRTWKNYKQQIKITKYSTGYTEYITLIKLSFIFTYINMIDLGLNGIVTTRFKSHAIRSVSSLFIITQEYKQRLISMW